MTNLLTPFGNRTFDRFDQMMEDFMGADFLPAAWARSTWMPSVDIAETDKEYKLHMDLPGFEQKDIEVELRGGVLSISGKREQKTDEKKDGKLIRYERRFGSFNRSFSLGAPVQADGVQAKFENGVLLVTVPKKEVIEAKKIPVQS